MEYKEFLESKVITHADSGFDVNRETVHDMLFDFQKDIVLWACRKGKSSIFADCGLGKTLMQLEWARFVYLETAGDVLIVAPLAVSLQTVQEGKKINIAVNVARNQEQIKPGINITNYEMLSHFNCRHFQGVVLDESSILKSYSGKIKQEIIESFKNTPYKLCCTATPSPNDYDEIGNHAEFLNIMSRLEMLSMFFSHNGADTSKWAIKGHAIKDFWKWVSSWAVSISKPSDFGYEDNGFALPELKIVNELIPVNLYESAGDMLFRMPALSATDYHKEKRLTIGGRAAKCAEIVNNNPGETFMIWCDTNYEADELVKVLPSAVEVRGDDKMETKERVALEFANGNIPLLISKPSIFGFGMNFQKCHNVIFCGLSYSYESFYQATRRFWRFGQQKPVNVYIVIGDTEKNILDVVQEKESRYMELKENMQAAMNQVQDLTVKHKSIENYNPISTHTDKWRMINGDSVEEIKHIKDECVHYTIFSPPFASLYVYSANTRDMGNNKSYKAFFDNFDYLIPEMMRITKPGRLLSFHCMDIPLMKEKDGVIGILDFPGDLIKAFSKYGWIYHSRHIIWKDPLIEATRTKALGLQHKQLVKDSSKSRAGLPDYVITMRKPGENQEPIGHGAGFDDYIGEDNITAKRTGIAKTNEYSHHVWRKYASPVWMDIRQSYTLNKENSREEEDEKHICPLQLDVIERCIALWSNPGDVVFSPFAGIGSEGYQAIKMERRFIGIELKESYYKQAIKYLNAAKSKHVDLFENYTENNEELAL